MRSKFALTKRRAVVLVLLLIVLVPIVNWSLDLIGTRVDAKLNRVGGGKISVSEHAKALHSTLTIVDLHSDSLLWNRDLLRRNDRGHVDVPRLIEGNVSIQTFSIVTKVPRHLNIQRNKGDTDDITLLAIVERWPLGAVLHLKDRVLHQAQKLSDFAKASDGKLSVLRYSEDVSEFLERRASNHNCVGGILSIEGAHALEGDLGNVQIFADAGVRMIGIEHFFDNEFGGSAHGEHKGGLTASGRELVRRLQQTSIIVDVAHSSPAVIKDVLAMATKPVVASHTGVKGTCSNERNLSEDELRGIARTGGLVGIGFWKAAVCGDEPRAIARAIKHAVRIAGIEHVALGSDFDGAVSAPFDSSHEVFVTQALIDEGFSDDQIRAIMGGNACRFFRQQLPHRDGKK